MTFQGLRGAVSSACRSGQECVLNAFARTYAIVGCGAMIGECADAVRELFIKQGFETQKFVFVDGDSEGVLLVIGKPKMHWNVQFLFGQSLSAWIRFKDDRGNAQIEIGSGKWIDKAFSGIVAWMLFAPLMVIPCLGAWRQYALIKYADEVVTGWLKKNRNRIGAIDV